MKKYHYSNKLPTQEGWYWFCDERGEEQVVQIRFIKHLGFRFTDGRLPADIEHWPGKWFGPLPKPEA